MHAFARKQRIELSRNQESSCRQVLDTRLPKRNRFFR